MRRIVLLTLAFCPHLLLGMEYSKLLENDHTIVSKWTVAPGEVVPSHRNEYPRVVIALQGGTITRIEADGTLNDVHFPTNEAVFLEADPVGQLHQGANKAALPIEGYMIEFKKQ